MNVRLRAEVIAAGGPPGQLQGGGLGRTGQDRRGHPRALRRECGPVSALGFRPRRPPAAGMCENRNMISQTDAAPGDCGHGGTARRGGGTAPPAREGPGRPDRDRGTHQRDHLAAQELARCRTGGGGRSLGARACRLSAQPRGWPARASTTTGGACSTPRSWTSPPSADPTATAPPSSAGRPNGSLHIVAEKPLALTRADFDSVRPGGLAPRRAAVDAAAHALPAAVSRHAADRGIRPDRRSGPVGRTEILQAG